MSGPTPPKKCLFKQGIDLPEKLVAGRGSNPRLVDNTLSSPQSDGIAVGKERDRDILRLYTWVARYRTLEASLNLTLEAKEEVVSLWTSILKLGNTLNTDPWYLDSEFENITKDNEARRKRSWLKWVAKGSKEMASSSDLLVDNTLSSPNLMELQWGKRETETSSGCTHG